jgi:hypothetical protein
MKIRHAVIMVIGLFLCINAFAQRECGTMDHLLEQRDNDPKLDEKMNRIEEHTQNILHSQYRAVNGVVSIPVVVHVLYNTSSENISDAQILSQITVLNDDFRRMNADADNTWSQGADTEIEFCMANSDPSGNSTSGITRTSTSTSAFGTNDNMKFNSSGGTDAWDASKYLNVWVCDISGGILGYAQFPGGAASTDGVVIDYQYFGTTGTATSPFDLGRTATHEVGHWLNLRHIWGDGGCSVDDFVSDTPESDGANYGCALGHSSCGTTDMVQNYMDYSDDACMNIYTMGQTTRMRALFEPGGARSSLLSSTACGPVTEPTCTDGIQNGDETGLDCGGSNCAPCLCNGTEVTVTITLDNYPEETSWSLLNANGATVASGGTYAGQADGSTVSGTYCLPDGCYDFTINDAYGDGICCSYGNGSYAISGGGSTLAGGGSFTFSETTNLCVGGSTGPTCNDGVQNGDETGIDCGGSCAACPTCNDGVQNADETGVDCGGSCAACPTCSDGIQNGDETGVDCGGSCAACPTCSDGIQNGDETGVDCGGSCAPCGGGGCSYVTIDSHNFFSNWGIWNDGGSDCARGSYSYALGTRCVRLRDNTNSSVMTTSNLNLSAYDEVTIDFTYVTNSMDNSNEDFWLQVSTDGGSSYFTIQEWNRGDEFENRIRYYDTVVMVGTFSASTRFRFRCDASGNNDQVYIDNVDITGCLNSSRESVPELVISPAETLPDLGNVNVYPNPANNHLTVDIEMNNSADIQVMITDFTGRVIYTDFLGQQSGQQQHKIDLGNYAQGVYHLHVITTADRQAKKFVIYR